MSTNLRKAQKHMQRATELLNQSQLGFGAPPESSSKRKREHVSEERIETNKEMRDKIKQRVEHEEYTLLQDMIDTGQHSDDESFSCNAHLFLACVWGRKFLAHLAKK